MNKIISILVITLILSSCAVYKPEVQQGNALSNAAVSQLQRGMSKAEVASLLGYPLLQDNFRSDRWDYVFYTGNGSKQQNKKNLTLIFSNDRLAQVTK